MASGLSSPSESTAAPPPRRTAGEVGAGDKPYLPVAGGVSGDGKKIGIHLVAERHLAVGRRARALSSTHVSHVAGIVKFTEQCPEGTSCLQVTKARTWFRLVIRPASTYDHNHKFKVMR